MAEDRLPFLRRLNAALEDIPLEPDDPRRVPIHEQVGTDDPVALMREAILLSDIPTLQLFSGFDGSGKTTELLRLRRQLQQNGYLVLYVSALDYFTLTEPLLIGDLLMGVAGALGDALAEEDELDIPKEGFWKRLGSFIERTELRISQVDAKFEYDSPGKSVVGGIKAGVNIKAELKTGSSFRKALQKFLSNSLPEFEREFTDYIAELVGAVHAARGKDQQIVLIFDQLERIRGGYDNWHEVIRATRMVFTDHLERLQLPEIHCVYSVPAWLTLLQGGVPGLRILPTVQLWTHDRSRQPSEAGHRLFRDIVRRRLGVDGAERLFGAGALGQDGPVDQLIRASGGHVRDLLRMIRGVIRRAQVMPVPPDAIDRAIAELRRDFLPIALDDAKLLHEVARVQDLAPESMDAPTVEKLSYFLNSHMVAYFMNGAAWYDIHPLIRDDVARLAATTAA